MSLSYLFQVLKGGAGSGNLGHAGIPGHRGGSAPSKSLAPSSLSFVDRYNKIIQERGGNIPLLLDDLDYFPDVKQGVKATGKRTKEGFGLCYLNAKENCKEDMNVAVGFVFDKEDIQNIKDFDDKKFFLYGDPQRPLIHAWNIDKDGKVVDVSLGSSKDRTYIGKIIPKSKLEGMNDKAIEDYAHELYLSHLPKMDSAKLDKTYEDWAASKNT